MDCCGLLLFQFVGVGGSVVGVSDLGPKGQEFKPCLEHVTSHSVSLHPGV